MTSVDTEVRELSHFIGGEWVNAGGTFEDSDPFTGETVATVAAGGPQGPPPLPGQQGLPGSPYSPQYGPAAPPPGQQSILTPQQAGLQQPPVQLPTPAQPYPFNPQTSPLGQLNPINWMNMIRASLNQPGGVPMSPQQAQLPGSAIMQGAGILPGSQGFGG